MQYAILVTTARGLDQLLFDEITTLCPEVSTKLIPGGVYVAGSLDDAYKLCLWSRLANRVLWILAQGPAANEQALYELANSIDWPKHMHFSTDFMVQFNGTTRSINNTQFGALRIKDAVVDRFVESGQSRPSVSKINPNLIIHARLHRDEALIAIDLSGKSLHQRHYRSDTGEAPLKEHVAAAMLYRSGFVAALAHEQAVTLVDPMCGSGTIAIEAALMASKIAPGLAREKWGFDGWLGHDKAAWTRRLTQAQDAQVVHKHTIIANDIDRKLVRIAKANADNAGVFDQITFSQKDALKFTTDAPVTLDESGMATQPMFLVSNPPYGERLGDLAGLLPMFQQFGDHLKQHFAGWRVSLLSSNRELLRQLRLRSKKEYALNNGKLECKLVNYVIDSANCEVVEQHSGQQDFANRLRKNLKKLKPFIKRADTNAYRIYDADLPDYNCAIDCYADWVVVQEYAPPKDIPAEKARRRLHDVLLQLPLILGVDTKKIALKVREQQKGKKQYQRVSQQQNRITVYEHGAEFYINPTDYLDTGLFLDHRNTRQLVKQDAKGRRVLNLFAYTGSVSVHAAKGGATAITTVDMSNTYLDWAKDNFRLNRLSGGYEFIQANCLEWLANNHQRYDLIFIDPPSFSNSKRMSGTWDVQRDHVALLADAVRCLNPGGMIYFSNNLRTFKLDLSAVQTLGLEVENISHQTLTEDFARNPKIHQCWRMVKAV